MDNHFQIIITAEVPGDNPELGHEAVVSTRDSVQQIVDLLTKLGLTNAQQSRKLSRKKVFAPVPMDQAAD